MLRTMDSGKLKSGRKEKEKRKRKKRKGKRIKKGEGEKEKEGERERRGGGGGKEGDRGDLPWPLQSRTQLCPRLVSSG